MPRNDFYDSLRGEDKETLEARRKGVVMTLPNLHRKLPVELVEKIGYHLFTARHRFGPRVHKFEVQDFITARWDASNTLTTFEGTKYWRAYLMYRIGRFSPVTDQSTPRPSGPPWSFRHLKGLVEFFVAFLRKQVAIVHSLDSEQEMKHGPNFRMSVALEWIVAATEVWDKALDLKYSNVDLGPYVFCPKRALEEVHDDLLEDSYMIHQYLRAYYEQGQRMAQDGLDQVEQGLNAPQFRCPCRQSKVLNHICLMCEIRDRKGLQSGEVGAEWYVPLPSPPEKSDDCGPVEW